MSNMNRTLPGFAAFALCSIALAWVSLHAEPASQDADRGDELFQQAREAATGGQTLHDYAFDLATIIEMPDGRRVRFTSYVQVIPPSVFRQHLESAAGSQTMFFTGDAAWQKTIAGRRDLPDAVVRNQDADLRRGHVLFNPPPSSVSYRGADEVEGKPVHVIQIADVAGAPLRLFLDQQTHDVLKRVYVGDAPDGSMAQVEEFLSGYVEVDGFRWPTSKRVVRNGKTATTSTASDIEINQGLQAEALLR